jgi:3-oxoacyl-[acyl-carrier-protein] synthase-1
MQTFITGDSILTPLGLGTEANFKRIIAGESGLKSFHAYRNFNQAFHGGIIEDFEPLPHHTKLESMLIAVLEDLFTKQPNNLGNLNTLLLIATTKGNIDILETGDFSEERAYLPVLSDVLGSYFKCANTPQIISNACVSGVSALIMAQRMVAAGLYDEVVICAADLLTEFVLSGFHSFNALSPEPCKPFDANRVGINLGEAAAALVVTKNATSSLNPISELLPGFGSNDANHISGPSRDGSGLLNCLSKLNKASASNISFINAHGTATIYNDEMEAIAFNRAGLQNLPVNSLKGYFGHTLGAAGLLEFILSNHSMHANQLIPSLGYEQHGVSMPLQVITKNTESGELKGFIKTASGFGGTNTAIQCVKL